MLVKDKAANMIEDQDESNEKEQEATEGKAHKEAEEEESKEFREEEQKDEEREKSPAPDETTSYVEQPVEGVEGDSELEENIDATEEIYVEALLQAEKERDKKHINSKQENPVESKESELEASMEKGENSIEGTAGKEATTDNADMNVNQLVLGGGLIQSYSDPDVFKCSYL